MIVLDTTTKSVEFLLAGAITTTQLAFTVSYVDLDSSFRINNSSENDGVSNNTSAVTIVSAPASGHSRQIKFLTIYQSDTVVATVTVQINNNGTTRIMGKFTMNPGDVLEYVSD